MLDIRFIRENLSLVKKTAKDKGIEIDLEELVEIDQERRSLLQKIETLNAEKRAVADQVQAANPEDKARIAEQGKEIKEQLAGVEPTLRETEERFNTLMYRVPNVPSDDTPIGPDESGNVEINRFGEPTKFDFEAKDHVELAEKLDLLDTERGVKTGGFRGYYLKNELALMHLGLMNLAAQRLAEKGFTIMTTPTIVREGALITSGHFPGDRDEIYEIHDHAEEGKNVETKYLAGTSEPALLQYHAGEILSEDDLPVQLAGFSPCYRREVGGYGKDTRGIYRVHEFLKVEQVVLCKNDLTEGLYWMEAIKENALELLRDLELPHRILQICTGDMGAGKYKMYDIETWMPSRDAYSETHSVSYLTDWQARRGGLRYRTKDGEIKYCHTLNNTMVASPRILIAILENFQNKDGSVTIPKILRPFMGNQKVLKPKG